MKDKNLIEIFENEIFEKNLDLGIDYMEIALDSIIKDKILKDIPIIKSLFTFYNVTSSIIARHNVKKIIVFLQEFQSKIISEENIEDFRKKLETNIKFKNEVLEIILLFNEKFTDIKQSKILANLLSSYIDKKINWKEFQELTFVLNSLNPFGYSFIDKFINKKKYTLKELLYGESIILASGIGIKFEERLSMTQLGILLYQYGIKPIYNKI